MLRGGGTFSSFSSSSSIPAIEVDYGVFEGNTASLGSTTSVVFNPGGGQTASLIFDQDSFGTFNGSISGDGSLQLTGTGGLTLTSSSSYTDGTYINGGVLSISTPSQINSGAGGVTLNGGILFVSNTAAFSASPGFDIITGGLAVAASDVLTISAPITSSGSAMLTIGTTQVANASGTVVFSGSNGFTGSLAIGLTTGTSSPVSYPATLSIGSLSNFGTISALSLQGTGTLLITGSTTFSSSMVTSIGNNGATISAAGITATFPGIVANVSGAVNNTLTLTGGGTVYLSGTANTFSGEFSVLDGTTFQINSAGSLGSSSSTAVIALDNSTLSSITSTIGSNRSLSVSGTSGTVNVAPGLSLTFSGPVTAAGGSTLFVTGGGTFSSFSSGSSIPALEIDYGVFIGDTASLNATESVIFNPGGGQTASLVFNQTSFGSFSGEISGTGSVTIVGPGGVMPLSKNSSYTQGTYVEGLLVLRSDPSTVTTGVLGAPTSPLIGVGGTVRTVASFEINRPIALATGTRTTFSPQANTILNITSQLNGLGSFVKAGNGSIILSGISNDFVGKVYVDEGLLTVSGDISMSVDPIVAAGALLTGTGIIGDSIVYGGIKGGEEILNAPVGELTIDGSLVLEPNSFYGVFIHSGQNSLVDVTGSITIEDSSACLVGLSPGQYSLDHVYTILEGASITGQFSTVTFPSGYFLLGELTYTPTTVLLSFEEKSIVALAEGQNAINTANALDGAISYNRDNVVYTITPKGVVANPPPQLEEVLTSLVSFDTTSQMTYALNQIQSCQVKAVTMVQENNMIQVRSSINRRMQDELDLETCTRQKSCKRKKYDYTVWNQILGESVHQDTKTSGWGPVSGYNGNTVGYVLGVDRRLGENFFVGALGGYTYSYVHWQHHQGYSNINSGYGALYGSALSKTLYGNVSIAGSWNSYSLHRNIHYPGVRKTAKSDHGGSQFLSHMDLGWSIEGKGVVLRPFESLDYIAQAEQGYSEYGAGQWDLKIKKGTSIMLRNELGLQLSKCFCFASSKWTVAPKISWVREVRIKGAFLHSNFKYANEPFNVKGYFPDRSLVSPGLMVTGLMWQDRLSADLYYDGDLVRGYSSHNYGGQVRVSF